jgi:hypothetical protein
VFYCAKFFDFQQDILLLNSVIVLQNQKAQFEKLYFFSF